MLVASIEPQAMFNHTSSVVVQYIVGIPINVLHCSRLVFPSAESSMARAKLIKSTKSIHKINSTKSIFIQLTGNDDLR